MRNHWMSRHEEKQRKVCAWDFGFGQDFSAQITAEIDKEILQDLKNSVTFEIFVQPVTAAQGDTIHYHYTISM